MKARHARVKGMPRRIVNMIAYTMQHDAHHPRSDLLAGTGTRPRIPLRRHDADVGLESAGADGGVAARGTHLSKPDDRIHHDESDIDV
jgi:hypothetical protein